MATQADEVPIGLELRVSRLEADVHHLVGDVEDIKIDLRIVSGKLDRMATSAEVADSRMAARADLGDLRTSTRTELGDFRASTRTDLSDVKTDLRELRVKVDRNFVWMIGSLAAMSAVLLGTMARGFHWL